MNENAPNVQPQTVYLLMYSTWDMEEVMGVYATEEAARAALERKGRGHNPIGWSVEEKEVWTE